MKEKIKKIIQEVENQGYTAYEIGKKTGLSTTGIQNIIDRKIKKPRSSTVEILYSFLVTTEKSDQKNPTIKVKEESNPYSKTKTLTIEEIIAQKVSEKVLPILEEIKLLLEKNIS